MSVNETKNTTILAMDVVGYSAKMNEDETGTTEKLKNARIVVEKIVKQESGRIFNTAGDSFMIEFSSTFNAVNTAIKIQKELHQINSKFELKDKLEFRMGVNLGDVIVDGNNLLGDGVNVAARLESIAPPGGICVSEIVYNLVKSKISVGFLNKGKQKLKNIKEEITCYYVDIMTGSADPKTFKPSTSSGTSKSIISIVAASLIGVVIATSYYLLNKKEDKALEYNILAVSPIAVVSDDESQINLAVGLTQDLSGGLKKAARSLNVVTLNEKPENISDLANNIGARYLISGSLSKAGDTIRISVKLTDTESLSEVWNENYDRKFTASNIFSIQDEIVNNVVDQLVGNGAILALEVAKNFSNTGTSNMNAYECVNYIRGQYFKTLSPDMHAKGVECLRKSVIDDPEYKEAWQLLAHMLAWGYSLYVPFIQTVTLEGLDEAERAIDQAIRIDKDFARAYATRAELAFYKRDWKNLMAYAEKAYELAPKDAANVGHISYIVANSGAGCNSAKEFIDKYNIDKEACKRLEWGGEVAKIANKLDAVSSLTFDNYGIGNYAYHKGDWQLMVNIMEQVPTPDFHIWNWFMGFGYHFLGETAKAKEFLDKAKAMYGENGAEKFYQAAEMWNLNLAVDERDKVGILKDQYGWN